MEELERHILSIESGKIETDNPIGTALTLRDLRSSGDPSQMISADLMESIQNIAAEVKALRDVRPNPYAYQDQSGNINLVGPTAVMENKSNIRFSKLMKQYKDASHRIRNLKAQKAPQKVIDNSEKELMTIMKQFNDAGLSTNDVFNVMRSYDIGFDYSTGNQ